MTMEVRGVSAIPSFGYLTAQNRVASPKQTPALNLNSAEDDEVTLSITNEVDTSKTVVSKPKSKRPFLSLTARK